MTRLDARDDRLRSSLFVFGAWTLLSFALYLVWELAQLPLYTLWRDSAARSR